MNYQGGRGADNGLHTLVYALGMESSWDLRHLIVMRSPYFVCHGALLPMHQPQGSCGMMLNYVFDPCCPSGGSKATETTCNLDFMYHANRFRTVPLTGAGNEDGLACPCVNHSQLCRRDWYSDGLFELSRYEACCMPIVLTPVHACEWDACSPFQAPMSMRMKHNTLHHCIANNGGSRAAT